MVVLVVWVEDEEVEREERLEEKKEGVEEVLVDVRRPVVRCSNFQFLMEDSEVVPTWIQNSTAGL